ncbi:MAG TPA: hypothetical protein VJ910_07310 [Desulfuromonadales bacterium]|nr:hypothetical protein [Desulfuromonadales bacterium]
MMIRIMYTDGGFDIVKPAQLNHLLEEKALISFKRADGWAVVGRDPMRRSSLPSYQGPERRQAEQVLTG